MLNEIVLLLAFLAYAFLYVFLIHRSHGSPVTWTWPVLCMAPALYLGWSVFGAAYDMSFTVELVHFLKGRMSPWEIEHNFPYLPGYPVLLTPLAWMTQSAAGIARGAKLVNLGFLIWFGLRAGRIAFPEAKDSTARGVLYFSCHPLLVAVSLWHGQFEIVVVSLLLLSMTFWLSSAKDTPFLGGFIYGLAVSVKHWPVLALPVLLSGPLRRIPRVFAGTLAAIIAILGLHLVLNGKFSRFFRILEYSGIPSWVGTLQALWLPEPRGWTFICVAVALGAGVAIRLKGRPPAEAGMFTLLFFLLLSFRTAAQYWIWFLAFAPFCLSGREGPFWLTSGSLAGIVLLLEWGFALGWQGEYPHATWQGNYPHLRDYPHVSSAAIWLFQLVWRPLFLIAVASAGVWYYRSYRAPAPHD
ncbi:MAG: glycosyltransferase family 87 protein [Candidatus Methylomirabilis sp.]